MKIIAVDDEMESLSNFLVKIINDKRIEYKFFLDNPLDSIEFTRTNIVDAAFLDIKMPTINGVDLAEKLIKINQKIKIVFITGFTYDEKEIKERLQDNLLGFCYKPFDSEKLNYFINKIASDGKREIYIKAFGPFDVFLNGKPIDFKSSKAKELLALLVAYNGSTLTMNEAICNIWPDKDVDLAKKLYRDAVWRLRKALKENDLGDLIDFGKAKTFIRKENIKCDYWDYLNGSNMTISGIDFMNNYDWSTQFLASLDNSNNE